MGLCCRHSCLLLVFGVGWVGLQVCHLYPWQRHRKRVGWTYTRALHTAQRMGPHLLGRNPQPLPTAYPGHFTSITKPRQGYLGAHISLAFVCLPSWICKHHCLRADLFHTQKARISASCLKESWDFDKTDGQAPLAPEKVSYAPRASGRGNLLRPAVAPTRTKKSCSSYCHLSLSNSTANNMSLCWGGGEQSEGEKKERLKYPKNSLQRFLKRREPIHAHAQAHTSCLWPTGTCWRTAASMFSPVFKVYPWAPWFQ